MRLFSEKVSPTLTDSPLNIIRVQDFSEIFFGVYEIEINKNKYPVEKISEHNGDPVVSVPVEMGGKTVNYPFVLTKGKFEILFNEQNSDFEIFESNIQNEPLIFTEEDRLIKLKVWDDRKNEILIQIEEAKKNALIAAKKEIEVRKNRQLKQIREESNQKKQALSQYLESARENLVDEFTAISHRIKDELVSDNDNKLSEIKETVDNKIQDLADSLRESLKKDFNNSSNLVDKSIKQLVKELYEKNINPKVDKELQNIAVEIHEKVSEIDKNLNSKLDAKADTSLLEGVNKEIGAIRDANIELNNSLNKGVQKALSRVGNVDKKIIQISEEFERKLDEKEQEVVNYFDEKLELVKEETLDITDEARKYFQNLIQESRNNLLLEIRKIKAEKPIEYVLETKNSGKVVKDWDSIEKDWNTKIHDKIENVKTDLRKYVSVYASGGGTNATQYQDGGTMNGDLNVTGSYLSGGVNLLDIFSGGGGGGGGGGSDVSSLSSNWQNTYVQVSTLSASWTNSVNNPITTTLSGDNSTAVFAISGADNLTNPSALIVAIDGALQEPTIDYTVNGNQITFTSPVLSGAKAVVTAPNNTNSYVASELFRPYTEISAYHVANGNDYTINCLVSSYTVQLPSAGGISGRLYNIKNSGSGIITLSAYQSQTIDGINTIEISQDDSLTIQSTNTNWIII